MLAGIAMIPSAACQAVFWEALRGSPVRYTLSLQLARWRGRDLIRRDASSFSHQQLEVKMANGGAETCVRSTRVHLLRVIWVLLYKWLDRLFSEAPLLSDLKQPTRGPRADACPRESVVWRNGGV